MERPYVHYGISTTHTLRPYVAAAMMPVSGFSSRSETRLKGMPVP